MTGKPELSLARFAVVVLAVWLPFSHVLDGLQPSSSVWRFRLRPVVVPLAIVALVATPSSGDCRTLVGATPSSWPFGCAHRKAIHPSNKCRFEGLACRFPSSGDPREMTGKPEPSLAQFAVVVLAVWLPFSHVLDGLQPSSSVWRFRLRPVVVPLAIVASPWWGLRLRLGRLGARTEKQSTRAQCRRAGLGVPLPVVWRSS